MPCNRATDNAYRTHHPLLVGNPQGELVADGGLVVPVMLKDERTGLPETARHNL
jgi:hypothetical protein